MRIRERKSAPAAEGDLTPMIDMTFQLIAFFMVLINFTEAEADQRVKLPESELAKPPETAYEEQLTIQLTNDGLILFAGEEMSSLDRLSRTLNRERQIIKLHEKKKVADVTIIIRADRTAQTGKVQEVIQACQEVGFEKFALRGRQAEARLTGRADET